MLDRIDLHLTLSAVPLRDLGAATSAERSEVVRGRVEEARTRQRTRYLDDPNASCNAQVSGRSLFSHLDAEARALLDSAAEALALSARAYHRVIKVARTIADLSHDERVGAAHAAEALRYRPSVLNRAPRVLSST